MPLPRYTYVVRKKGAKGWLEYHRFRHPKTGDTKLPGAPGDSAYHTRYGELLAQIENGEKALPTNSMSWLIRKYRDSAEFRALRGSTQLDYSRTLDVIDTELGEYPFHLITRAMIKHVRDSYEATPRKAHKIKQMLSRLYSWADENSHVPADLNPTKGIRRLKVRTKTIEPWLWEEVTAYLAEAKPFEAAPVMLAVYTGQRIEDVSSMLWNQWQGDTIRIRQSKTGELVIVPCHPRLKAFLASLKTNAKSVTICYTATGMATNAPRTAGIVRRCLDRCGITGRSMHGLRYLAAGTMDEAGCTVEECESILGHRTFKMALQYMGQVKRAKRAMDKMQALQE